MQSKAVEHVTSNEQLVRQRIFDGVIPMDKAGEELIELLTAQYSTLLEKYNDLKWRIEGLEK